MAMMLDLINSKASVDVAQGTTMGTLLQRAIPEERLRELDMVLEMLLNGFWHERRVVLTKDKLSFTFEDDENEIDYIPLRDIEYVKDMTDMVNPGQESQEGESGLLQSIQIATRQDGHNSGRSYCLRAETNEICQQFALTLRTKAKAAKKRAEAKSMFQRLQRRVRKIYDSNPFQGVVAAFITANFVFTIVESQEVDQLVNEDGTASELANLLNNLNQAFTYVFTAELCINAFSHWFKPFIQNLWNTLDIVVVAISIMSIIVTNQSTGIVRIMRALRVIRLFGRLKALKKIITALALALLPVLNVFLILFLLISIAAIVGVTLFREVDPDDFAVFSLAFFTLFHVTAGDPWPESLPRMNEDGTLNWTVALYSTVFTIIVIWVILQVSVAVLLDNFISASTHIAIVERLKHAEQKQREQQLKNPLEPLLLKLAKEFTDSQDLSERLQKLYLALDTDRSGGLDSQEFCAAMKKLDFKPCIHISDSDFDGITLNGELCDERGQLGPTEFENVMRQQIRHMAQSKLSLITEVRSPEETDFMLHGSLKMIFMEQTRMEQVLDQTAKDVRDILACVKPPAPAPPPTVEVSASPNVHRRRRSTIVSPSFDSSSLHTGSDHSHKGEGPNPKPNPALTKTLSNFSSDLRSTARLGSASDLSISFKSDLPPLLSAFGGFLEKKFDEMAAAVVGALSQELSDLQKQVMNASVSPHGVTSPRRYHFVTSAVAELRSPGGAVQLQSQSGVGSYMSKVLSDGPVDAGPGIPVSQVLEPTLAAGATGPPNDEISSKSDSSGRNLQVGHEDQGVALANVDHSQKQQSLANRGITKDRPSLAAAATERTVETANIQFDDSLQQSITVAPHNISLNEERSFDGPEQQNVFDTHSTLPGETIVRRVSMPVATSAQRMAFVSDIPQEARGVNCNCSMFTEGNPGTPCKSVHFREVDLETSARRSNSTIVGHDEVWTHSCLPLQRLPVNAPGKEAVSVDCALGFAENVHSSPEPPGQAATGGNKM